MIKEWARKIFLTILVALGGIILVGAMIGFLIYIWVGFILGAIITIVFTGMVTATAWEILDIIHKKDRSGDDKKNNRLLQEHH